MVLRLVSILFIFCLVAGCERIPESERRSVLLNQEETTRRLQDFRRWLWTCRSLGENGEQSPLGEKLEKFLDIFQSRGLSSVEDFDVSQIRSAAFMWRETGVLVSNLSSFKEIKNIECTNGLSGWKKAEVKGSSRAMDLIVFQIALDERLNLRSRWSSRDDRPRVNENIYLVSATYPAQIDILPVKVQPQLTQMRTGIDSQLILFSPIPSEVYRGGVLVDETMKVLGVIGWDATDLWGTAISSSQVESTVKAVLSKGFVEYPFLGFKLGPVSSKGLMVRQIEIGSPAYRSGLRVGDILVQWNGGVISSVADWVEPTIADIGKNIPLTYERAGKKIETQIAVGSVK